MDSVTTHTDHAAYVRQTMRQTWPGRMRAYTEEAAPHTGAHSEVLLRLVPPAPGQRILDVATGPGTVALRAAERVGPEGAVVATDLTPEWEEVIGERATAAGVRNLRFQAMGAEALDLPDDHFDVAYCQFGLMFVPDPVQALREMRRVLRPEGRAGVVVWSTADRVLCFSAVARLLAPFMPRVPEEQQLPTPLSLGEPGLVERHAAAAGFRDIRVARHTLDFVIESPERVWQDRVEHGQPQIKEAVARLGDAERAALRERLIGEMQQYVRDGKVRLPSEAVYVSAVK